MNLSLTLDVAISLIFVYVLASLLASTVNEMIAGWFRLRGVYLTKAIEEMTSLGKNNQFGWGGLGGWLNAVWQAKVSAVSVRRRSNKQRRPHSLPASMPRLDKVGASPPDQCRRRGASRNQTS